MGGTQFGIPPKNIATLDYTGADLALVPVVEAQRDPNVTDKNYPIDCLWRNSTSKVLWYLSGFDSTGALWLPFTTGPSGPALTFSVPLGLTPITPTALGGITFTSTLGTVNITGVTGPGLGDHTINFDLSGGGIAVDTFTVQAATAPGVNPVTPDGLGNVTVNAAAVAAHSVPIETRTRALNAYNVEVQYASAVAAADATKSGIAHFNNTQFTVDANGFVALAGGGLAIDQIGVDANTAPGTNPVLPAGTGQVTVTGAQVAAGTVGANVIRTDSLAANTYTIEIQRSTAVASTASANNGVSHYSSDYFSVDANGFVTGRGGALKWQTTSASIVNLSVNNGYICISPGGALTLGLPATATIGDVIEVTLDGATSFQITQAAGQQIRVANSQTTLGATGSITTTASGDTLRMVAQSATKWNVLSYIGNLTVA